MTRKEPMKVTNYNRSVQRTRQLIKTAFAELVDEKKSVDKVTVSELVERAGVTRGTFYNHYDNLHAVAEDFEAEILELLPDDADVPVHDPATIDAFFDKVFRFVKANEATYRMLLSADAPASSFRRLNLAICQKIYIGLKSCDQRHSDAELHFAASFFTDGVVDQVIKYFTGEYAGSLEQIFDHTKQLFKLMFTSVK